MLIRSWTPTGCHEHPQQCVCPLISADTSAQKTENTCTQSPTLWSTLSRHQHSWSHWLRSCTCSTCFTNNNHHPFGTNDVLLGNPLKKVVIDVVHRMAKIISQRPWWHNCFCWCIAPEDCAKARCNAPRWYCRMPSSALVYCCFLSCTTFPIIDGCAVCLTALESCSIWWGFCIVLVWPHLQWNIVLVQNYCVGAAVVLCLYSRRNPFDSTV